MGRIRIVAVDGEDAQEVQAVLAALTGIVDGRVPGAAGTPDPLLELAAGPMAPAATGGADGSRSPAKKRRKAKARGTPPARNGREADQVEEISLEEDIGVLFQDGSDEVLITRGGRGGHKHHYTVPNRPGEVHTAVCPEKCGQDKHVCGETRRFRLQ